MENETMVVASSRNKMRLCRYTYREGAICEISLAYLLPSNTIRSTLSHSLTPKTNRVRQRSGMLLEEGI
jgi:hypothetical protein